MAYEPKNFDHLIGTDGFSNQLLKNHFTLYQGYVKNTNAVADALSAMAKDGKTATPEFAELKRRFGWEYNGMKLHELYFGNMKKGGATFDKASKLNAQMDQDFGSEDHSWTKEFQATGAMRGIGWVVLYWDTEAKRLFNVWVNEHDVGHLAGCVPLLVMDVFEHAFITDYGLKKADYIEAFRKAIDWDVVSKRFEAVA